MQRNHRYHFDKIIINAKQHLATLSALRERRIEGVSIMQAGIIAHNWGYQARISFEQPYEHPEALLEAEKHLTEKYHLSYIEIAHEFQIDDLEQGEQLVIDASKDYHFARSPKATLFEWAKAKRTTKSMADKIIQGIYFGKASDYALYLAPKNSKMNFAMYCARSKIGNGLVLKSEFRIKGAMRIYKEIGCSNLADIARLDIKQAFLSLSAKHLQRRQIDLAAVGRLLAGKHRGRQEQAERAGALFCRLHRIKSPSDLTNFLKDSRLKLDHAERLYRFDPRPL